MVDETYKNKSLWAKKCINAASRMGKFSSDRSIKEYAERIWLVFSFIDLFIFQQVFETC